MPYLSYTNGGVNGGRVHCHAVHCAFRTCWLFALVLGHGGPFIDEDETKVKEKEQGRR